MFPTGDQFDGDPLKTDGAGGIAFTGAPRYAGHSCEVCHTAAPHKIGVELQADPVGVFDTGYVPGQTIHFRVVMTHEWAAIANAAAGDNCGDPTVTPYVACDDNGFSFEVDGATGPVGTYKATDASGGCSGAAAAGADVRVLKDGTAITHENLHHGRSYWDFCWKAPAAGTGPVTAYVAAVDGNAGLGTAAFPNDTIGDDTFASSIALIEQGGSTRPPEGGGCNTGAGGAGLIVPVLAVALLRRRRAIAVAVVAVLGLAASGCAHVGPQQREILAKKKMTFGPDPAEDELDLHMQEAREGSAGGYGSAGGGCGCN